MQFISVFIDIAKFADFDEKMLMSAELDCAKFHYLAVPKMPILNRVNINLEYLTRKNTEENIFWDKDVVKSVI